MEAKWSQHEGILEPSWPTNHTPLADLLHTISHVLYIVGRLITHRCPTYYMQPGYTSRHIPTTATPRPTCCTPRPTYRTPRRACFTLWLDHHTPWPTYYTRGSGGGQTGGRRASDGRQTGSGVGHLSVRVGIEVSWTLSIYLSIY